MKLVNPIGREAASGHEDGYHLRACMCSTEGGYVSAKGNDSCFHCGCHCDPDFFWGGNNDRAAWTFRSSKP